MQIRTIIHHKRIVKRREEIFKHNIKVIVNLRIQYYFVIFITSYKLLYHKPLIKFPLELQSDQDEHPMIAQVRILTASSRFVHCMIAREPKYDGKPYDSRRNAI